MIEELKQITELFKEPDDRSKVLEAMFADEPRILDYLKTMNFVEQPASAKYHGNYDGGLFDHSVNVAYALEDLTCRCGLKWVREDYDDTLKIHKSCLIIGMLHDICKVDCYMKVGNGYKYRPTADWSHGKKSGRIVKEIFPDVNEEELSCIINHMGPFGDKDVESAYTAAIKTWPNVLWTHTADMIASQLIEKEE